MTDETVGWLNQLAHKNAVAEFRKCCGAAWWCERMANARPFANASALISEADRLFNQMSKDSWLEAFDSHPKIGDLDSLRMRLSGNKQWSSSEQAGIQETSEQVLSDLASGNQTYEQQFGYIFIVCATGLSAEAMLSRLQERLGNDKATEFRIASREQQKITHLRLEKLKPNE